MAVVGLDAIWIAVCERRCNRRTDAMDFQASTEVGTFLCKDCRARVDYVKVGMWMLNGKPMIDGAGFHRLWIR